MSRAAKAAPSFTVKVVVWVMNPGPIAEVSSRNVAPSNVDLVLAYICGLGGGRRVRGQSSVLSATASTRFSPCATMASRQASNVGSDGS